LDVIATEERPDWKLAAHLYWFEPPANPRVGEWTSHLIGRHRSLNSMDVGDVDRDGGVDIVVAEHTDQKGAPARDNLTLIYLNPNRGRTWQPWVVERGPHSSHLGAKLVNIASRGAPEIVSMGWNEYRNLHRWMRVTERN
jgi:hypothetical protein